MKYIDISHELKHGAPVYPGDPVFELNEISTISDLGFSDFLLKSGLHVGTHIDAPGHMLEHGKYLSEFPIDTFIGRAICIDVRNVPIIRKEHIRLYQIVPKDIVILHSGYTDHYGAHDYFSNHPVLHIEATEWLVSQNISMLGMDMPGPDREPYDIHKRLFERDILLLENLNIPSAIPYNVPLKIWALPMHLKATAAPARVVLGLPA